MMTHVVDDGVMATFVKRQWELQKMLAEGTRDSQFVLDGLQSLIDGRGMKYTIDLDIPPVVPSGWRFQEEDQLPNRLRGKLVWDPAKFGLWLSENQQERVGVGISGINLLVEIKKLDLSVYPAQVLDFLLAHPDQIPEKCKGKNVFFWSPYRNSRYDLYVRHLCCSNVSNEWHCFCHKLDHSWGPQNPAAVLAG